MSLPDATSKDAINLARIRWALMGFALFGLLNKIAAPDDAPSSDLGRALDASWVIILLLLVTTLGATKPWELIGLPLGLLALGALAAWPLYLHAGGEWVIQKLPFGERFIEAFGAPGVFFVALLALGLVGTIRDWVRDALNKRRLKRG